MSTKEQVAAFIDEYENICRKYTLYIDISVKETLDIFKLGPELNDYLADWRTQNES